MKLIDSLPIASRIPAAVAMAALLAVSLAHADETCNSPYIANLIKGQEDYVYVWALGVEGLGDGSDKLVTVDVNPASKTYGKVLGQAPVGTRCEAHHMGYTDDRRRIWAGGLAGGDVYVFDIATDPAKPKLVKTIKDLTAKTGLSDPTRTTPSPAAWSSRRSPTGRTRAVSPAWRSTTTTGTSSPAIRCRSGTAATATATTSR
jgi:hypothetical protein